MKYLLSQLLILILSVIILLYFFSLEYFLPIKDGIFDWYNIFLVIFFIFLSVQSIVSIVFFLSEKFLTCGIKEFPRINRSLKWGIAIGLCSTLSILFSIFNILPLFYAFSILVIILIILNIIKIF